METDKKFKILIAPLGLIGGSLALALKRARDRGQLSELFPQGAEVWGMASDEAVLEAALEEGAVSRGFILPHVEEGRPWRETLLAQPDIFKADFIIFCSPVETIPPLARFFGAHSEALMTDVGSVKGAVCKGCAGLNFIGGHPMAGSERRGYYCADEALFDHACYAFCPTEKGPALPGSRPENAETKEAEAEAKKAEEREAFLRAFAGLLGARALFLSPAEHDRLVARISHLPHVTAAALVNAALAEEDRLAILLSAGGFRDITRIASSDPDLWTGICLESGAPLREALRAMIGGLEEMLEALEAGDEAALRACFAEANEKRAWVPRQGVGPLVSDVQILINIEDKPGVLARLTALLSGAGINIHNLAIQDARQYEGGQVRLFIASPAEAERARELLRREGFDLAEKEE